MSKSKNTTENTNPFVDMITEMNPMKVFQPMMNEMQSQLKQNAKDWMSLQQEVQQTMQTVMKDNSTQMVSQLQQNVKQGVELSKTMMEAQMNLMQETSKMFNIMK